MALSPAVGSDMQKLGAMSALDVLSVNNAAVHKQLNEEGAPTLLSGLAEMGSSLLREEAKAFGSRLAGDAPSKKLSADAHVKAARQTRTRYHVSSQYGWKECEGWPWYAGAVCRMSSRQMARIRCSAVRVRQSVAHSSPVRVDAWSGHNRGKHFVRRESITYV